MPRITDITETRRGRYALFLDGEFAFSLDAETFADAHLHIDDALETWQAEDLRAKSDTRRALDKAMELLALRDHAAGELYQKLCRKFDPHSAAAAVAKAGELGLLNDENFARRRAAELLRKRKSRREILQDLAAKGIDPCPRGGAGWRGSRGPRPGLGPGAFGKAVCPQTCRRQNPAGCRRPGPPRVFPHRHPRGN